MAPSAGSTGGGPEAGRAEAANGSPPADAAAREELLRALPAVERLAARLGELDRTVAVAAAREAVAARRAAIESGAEGSAPELEELAADARRRARAALAPRLVPVLNATGVVVHTNLGRAPLAPAAVEAVTRVASGYSNLEYDLASGRRGSRQAHLERALCDLTGAEAAAVVNNCAGAVLLAAAALAAGREVVVSRGQLIEIGGSFRIPDVVAQSGARLVEVGTTNRTRLADYEAALGPETGALLRAHPSNFRTVGFTEEVAIEELCEVGAGAGVPVVDDAGSGALASKVVPLGEEPAIARSVAAGAALVCFSGDKLLGGPQAGLIVGSREAVERCRSHPLARALRPDKLQLAALEATLRLYRDPERALREVPVLRMLVADRDELRSRAELMCGIVSEAGGGTSVVEASSRVGGGALPLLELEGPACAVEPGPLGLDELALRLRESSPPVVARARDGRLLLDPRTLTDEDARLAAEAVAAALH